VENRKFFSEKFLSTLETIQTNLKQVEVDESFNVVDNKKEEHRYKYTKKVLYIEKGQIEEAAEVAKFLESETSTVVQHQ
jgi:ABC-type arginine transport system ATPase subunit